MTTPSLSLADRIADEALDIVVLLLSGEATDADASEINAWRARGPAHEGAFRDAVRVWRGLAQAARSAAPGGFRPSPNKPAK